MAEQAEKERESAAEELIEAIRQTERHTQSARPSVRIIAMKMKKVEEKEEELKRMHYTFCSRSGIAVDSAEARTFLQEKIDKANDCIDSCMILIEEQELNESKDKMQAEEAEEQKKREKRAEKDRQSVLAQITIEETFAKQLCQKIKLAVESETHSVEEAVLVKSYKERLEKKFEELENLWDKWVVDHGDDAKTKTNQITASKLTIQDIITAALVYIEGCHAEKKHELENLRDHAEKDGGAKATQNWTSKLRMEKMGYPKFSGDIRTYAKFLKDFETLVAPSCPDETHRALVLKMNCLEGAAKTLVQNTDHIDDIWARLKDRYGDKMDLVDVVIKELEKIQPLKGNDDQRFIEMVDSLDRGLQELDAIEARSEIANAYTVKLIEGKLSRPHYLNWLKEEDNLEGDNRFQKMFQFLKAERRRVEKLVQRKMAETEPKTSKDTRDSRSRSREQSCSVGQQQQSRSATHKCILHPQGTHFTRKCRQFLAKNAEQRAEIVKTKNGCVFCLSDEHGDRPCPWQTKWEPCKIDNCGQYHSHLMHEAIVQGHMQNQQRELVGHIQEVKRIHILLLVQRVPTTKGVVTTFFDSGSTISLVSTNFVKRHQLKGVKVNLELITVGGECDVQDTYMHDITLIDARGKQHVIQAFELSDICGKLNKVDVSQILKLFKGLRASDVERCAGAIELLVGINYANIHPKHMRESEGLVLFSSKFGTKRVLGGGHPLLKNSDQVSQLAQRTASCQIKRARVIYEKDLDPGIDFFSAEDFGVKLPPNCEKCQRTLKNCKKCSEKMHQMTRVERRELAIIEKNLILDPIGNCWITVYPLKNDPNILENNVGQAEVMLKRFERRILPMPERAKKVRGQFNDFVDRSIFTEISKEEEENYTGPVFYGTIHEIIKEESSSTPTRLVSHSSLKYKGISFNDILMKGPNTLNNIYGVQLRLRSHTIALIGDVSKMFHSIKTTEQERHLRRILWRDLNPDAEIKTYGVDRVQFGDRPAGAIATVAMRKTAEIFKDIHPQASEKIINDCYMDDIATGGESYEEVEELQQGIEKILAKGGFKIKGFVKSGDTSEEALSLLGTGEMGRVLGIGWDPKEDNLKVKVRINFSKKYKSARTEKDLGYEEIPNLMKMRITRGMLLSVTNSCYDPLGLLCPITVKMKIGLRKMYNKEYNIGWEDDVPEFIKEEWVKTLQEVKKAEKVTFKRCVKPPGAKGDPDLIICNDASEVAMCATAHVRWECEENVKCVLWTAKSRVTPLRRQTIPRNEMQSAVMATRLAEAIKSNAMWKFKKIYHISDSECTLSTLRKDTTILKEFMGNRVAEILDTTSVEQWYHVPSGENIADLGTRGHASEKDVAEDSNWQNGPPWMSLPIAQWPVKQDVKKSVPEEELILNKVCAHVTNKESLIPYEKYAGKSYNFMLTVTAMVSRIRRRKSFKGGMQFEVEDISRAEKEIAQHAMIRTRKMMEAGKLTSLRPKVDSDGIIKLNSRALEGMKLFYENEDFIILAYDDPVAYAWIKQVHEEDHSGVSRTVAKSRRKFWVVNARKLATKIKGSCYRCRLMDKECAQQQMAPLPMSRQRISPTFYKVSLDLFGPFEVRDMIRRRTKKKVWGMILTCSSTRAIHIEICEDYGTESVIRAIRKFIALRGSPSEIFSDKGAQLVAAAEELKTWALREKITWRFAPAEGQHHNGVSESLVKSIKRSLSHVIGENIVSYSELETIFYEVATLVNARPIGIVSGSDPDEPTPITPNHLILGRSTPEVPIGEFEAGANVTRRFRFLQSLVNQWWNRWYQDVLPSLVPAYRWHQRHRNVKPGDVVLIRYKNELKGQYRLGRVFDVKRSADNLVRTVKIKYKNRNEDFFREVDRPVQGIAVIVPVEEQSQLDPNAKEFEPSEKSNLPSENVSS